MKLHSCESYVCCVLNSPIYFHCGNKIVPTKTCDLSHIVIEPKLSVDLNDNDFSVSSNHSDEPNYEESLIVQTIT